MVRTLAITKQKPERVIYSLYLRIEHGSAIRENNRAYKIRSVKRGFSMVVTWIKCMNVTYAIHIGKHLMATWV